MSSITFDLGNTPSVLEALRNPHNAQLIANAMAESYVDDMLDWIRDGRSFTPREAGGLEQSIFWTSTGAGEARVSILDRNRVKRDAETGRSQVVNAKDYGEYVEHGTDPHVIGPKSDRRGVKMATPGGWVLRRSFNHPGSRAFPFFFVDMDARKQRMQERALSVLAGRIANDQ